MPDDQNQFRKSSSAVASVSAPRSSPQQYARPPVQVLNVHTSAPSNGGKGSQLPATSSGNSFPAVRAIPYGSSNSQLLPYSNGVISRGNDQVNGRNSLTNRDVGRIGSKQPFQPNPSGNTLGKNFPLFTAPSSINNKPLNSNIPRARSPTATSVLQYPTFSSNVQEATPVKTSPLNVKNPSFFDTFNIDQNANFGQQFSAPQNNKFFNPSKLAQPNPAPPRQNQNDNNYIPILSRGFSVPTTYTNRGADRTGQDETLSAVANPSDNKREIIGSYLPQNDFVNPELFVIPTEDKHNIVSRIFGGFQNPTVGNINPQTPNLNRLPDSSTPIENHINNGGYFNIQNTALQQSDENPSSFNKKNANVFDIFNKAGGSQVPDDRRQPENFNRDNNINLNKFDRVHLPQGNNNLEIPNFDKSHPSLGTFSASNQNGLKFDGGLNNPGSFARSEQSVNAKMLPDRSGAAKNIANNKGQDDVLNINAFAEQEKSFFGSAPSFNNNPIPVGNKGFGIQLDFGNQPQVENFRNSKSPTKTAGPPAINSPKQPSRFNSIDSFKNADIFSNPKQGFRGPLPVRNQNDNALKGRNVFMNQPAPVPLFSDFSQAKPLTVDGFRSKNLLGDENFGRTEYDRTRPTSLNVLSDGKDFFGGDKFFEGDHFNFHLDNRNLGKGSGTGAFQQVDGGAITEGDSYDNVYSTKQGYNKNFNDNSNVASSKPSSFAKQGGFTNTYQQNNGFDRAGAVSNGNDYGHQFTFKDGDNVSNQKTSSNHNEGNFRNSFEDQQHAGDQKSYSNADGYNNAFVNGRRYDLSDGYTDNVKYNTQNSGSSQQGANHQDNYRKGVANVAANLANQRPDFYSNLPTSINEGLPEEASYKPFDINKPVFNGVQLT